VSSPADTVTSTLDFEQAIAKLENRARRSRRRVSVISGLLAIGLFSVVITLLVALLDRGGGDFSIVAGGEMRLFTEAPAYDRLLRARAATIAEELSSGRDMSVEDQQQLLVMLDQVVDRIERARMIERQSEPDADTSLVPLVTSSVFSIGVMGIILYGINICLSFIRYHLQLAELYEAQADALRASGGSAQTAYEFISRFSPAVISIGKMPTTVYEKAFDAIKEVAAKGQRP
jgi:hypothetical protein